MNRKKIQALPGSIAPAKYARWAAADDKLREAYAGIQDMRRARDRVEYQRGWTRFVDAIEVYWQRIHTEGKANFCTFMQWVKPYNELRKSDALLSYLLQARHDNTHGGLQAIIWPSGVSMVMGHGGGTFSGAIIYNDGSAEIQGTAQVHFDAGNPALGTILNKDPRAHGAGKPKTHSPPLNHRGKSIAGITPHDAAMIAFRFYESAFCELLKTLL